MLKLLTNTWYSCSVLPAERILGRVLWLKRFGNCFNRQRGTYYKTLYLSKLHNYSK